MSQHQPARRRATALAIAAFLPAIALVGCNKAEGNTRTATPVQGSIAEPEPLQTVEGPDGQMTVVAPSATWGPDGQGGTSAAAPAPGGGKAADSGDSSKDGNSSGSNGSGGSSKGSADAPARVTMKPAGPIADGLIRAWGRGSRGGATGYATAGAINSLFGAKSVGGPTWARTGCSSGVTATCRYTDGNGGVVIVTVSTTKGLATGASYSPGRPKVEPPKETAPEPEPEVQPDPEPPAEDQAPADPQPQDMPDVEPDAVLD